MATQGTEVAVGDVLLFRISDEVQRPLLVVHIAGPRITGELFLHFELDRTADWVRRTLSFAPSREERTFLVEDAEQGKAVGQWQFRSPAENTKKKGR